MVTESDEPRPRRRRWRWLVGLCGLVVLVAIALVAALPWYLSSPAGRSYLLGRADRSLAPGRLDVKSFRFSWFGPTRMTGFVLIDPQGRRVVEAPAATWDRNLWQVLFDPLHRGTLHLQREKESEHPVFLPIRGLPGGKIHPDENPKVILTRNPRADVKLTLRRLQDGKINLYETLRPVLKGDPRTDVKVTLSAGRVEVHDPGFTKPWTGRLRTISLHLASIPAPVSWHLEVVGDAGEQLTSRGTVEHPRPTRPDQPPTIPDLAATFDISAWPIDLTRSGLRVYGIGASKIALAYSDGRWKTSGELNGSKLMIGGKPLAGDTLRLVTLRGIWDVGFARDFTDAKIKSLYVNLPMGGFSVEGSIPPAPGATSVVEGNLDLAPLAAQLPHLFRTSEQDALSAGTLRVKAQAKGEANAPASWDVRADVAGLAGTIDGDPVSLDDAATLRARLAPADPNGRLPLDLRLDMGENPWLDGPIALEVDGGYLAKSDRLELNEAILKTGKGDATLAGAVDHLTTRRDADLNAQWTPDWPAINAVLQRRIEPGANLEGGPISLHVVGSLARISLDEIPKDLDAAIQIPITHADVYGLKVGQVKIAARSDRGNLSIDPIETTLNGGVVHLEPTIDRDPGGDGFTARLGEASTIVDARINDEVSHRVLSFLVPFMANATSASGMLDVQLSRAEFPIGSTAGRKTLVEGEVVFNDVEFAPGPLIEDLFAGLGPLARNARPSVLQLNHPVVLSIHDSQVYQHGLAFPLGNVSEIAVDGSVGFDKSIDLTVTLPITTAMLGGPNPLDGNFGGDLTRFTLPITGTLSKPKIDPDAFRLGMRQTGRVLLQNGILQGANDLLQLFNRPRDPNAPPPLTPEQRREMRLQKKQERQMRREMRRNGGILP